MEPRNNPVCSYCWSNRSQQKESYVLAETTNLYLRVLVVDGRLHWAIIAAKKHYPTVLKLPQWWRGELKELFGKVYALLPADSGFTAQRLEEAALTQPSQDHWYVRIEPVW